MPLYGYYCPQCRIEFETISKMDQTLEECPQCHFEHCARESFPKTPPFGIVKGASAANNYGLKRTIDKKNRPE